MDISKVQQAITLCVTAHNQAEIQNGQKYLESIALEAEYPLKLMMVVDRSDLDINIRQFAATELKNSIKKFWKPKKDQPRFSEQDKMTVKNNLLDALIRSADNSKLCKMYCKIIIDVCAYDFPKEWPNLVDQAVAKLAGSETPNVIFGCLLALQQVFDNLQFEMEDRTKLDAIIQVVFPTFQILISKLMGIYNADNAYILKPILKCFYMSINLEMPVILQGYDNLSQWINFFKLLLDSEMPANLTTPTTNEDVITQRDKHPLWKNKKWAGRILTKFIMRYANKAITTDKNMQNLAQWLIDTHMGPIMHSFVKQLQLSQTIFVGNACVHFGVKFLIKTLRTQSLFDELKPQLDNLLYDCLFPMLFLTPRDNELWNSDPAEFIRQEDDFINGGLRNNKNLVMDLIRGICSNPFSNNVYLHQFVMFCANYLDTNVNPRNNQVLTLAIKDGIFFAFGQLKDIILKDDVLKGQIEALLEKYILPEFQNTNPFIRSRTCWVFGRYGFVEFRNNQNVITAVQGITACMKDENLPVKFKAALALHSIISHKQAQDMVRSYLSEILRIYLKLMEEIDSEELVASLEGIVEQFQNDIGPYAYDLCVHLSSAFYKLRQKDNEADEEDDGECQLAAGGCLEAIGKILTSPITPDVLAKLEEIILPILDSCLIDDQCDFMDESLHLLQQLVFKATQIAPSSQLWFYYPILIYIVAGKENPNLSVANHLSEEKRLLIESAVNGWGPEHINEIVIILKNFIQKGGEFFLTASDIFGVSFVELLFHCVLRVYQQCQSASFDDDEESCMKNVLSVFYCLIENHKVDQKISNGILQDVIKHSLANLNLPKIKKEVLVANIETLCLCFYYNATETFQLLYSICGADIVLSIFERWFLLLGHFKSDFAKQRLLLGFTSIIACQQLPDEVRSILPIIVKHCVQITTDIVKLREEEDFQDVDEDEDETAENGNFGQTLSDHVKKIQDNTAKSGDEHVEEDNEDDDDDEFDGDYDPLDKYQYNYSYNCPLENMDEIIFLEQNLLQIAQANPQSYQILTQQLNQEEKQTLQQNIATSKQQYEEYLKSKQEQTQ